MIRVAQVKVFPKKGELQENADALRSVLKKLPDVVVEEKKDEDDFKFDPDTTDPDVLKLVDRLKQAGESNAKLAERVDAMEKANALRVFKQEVSAFDTGVVELGEEWKNVFGSEKSAGDMDKRSKTFKNRTRLWSEATAYVKTHGGTMGQALKPALRSAFGDEYEATTRAKIAAEVSKGHKRISSKPSQRSTKKATGMDALVASSEKLDARIAASAE